MDSKSCDLEKLGVTSIGVVEIKPGDLVVLKTDVILSKENLFNIAARVKDIPVLNGCSVILLDGGMSLDVYRQGGGAVEITSGKIS